MAECGEVAAGVATLPVVEGAAVVSSGGSGGPVPAMPDCANPAAGSNLPTKTGE